ncbi:FimB/Mfa2 family fimbrial subunit [Chitinophaga nivalis]|uniref:FimB/Mfa2 family fimbrial subunit n=1 Tax=Chitinophaga nivalis TaxID=2991709 RepID=A0ABT3INK5_9BACT|nr:FimB/Mfa2 family fimbrial subunit [Chitinophaga nivalis]MCW3464828.1 FimB/Mfa2 family fimbrial subunit [Chitinophaga nivalis]MCW3485481.1 FimB/Mfa2 family fimbrial subunit [Chitinophaga nivalis]
MKKLLLIPVLASLLFSCKKEDSTSTTTVPKEKRPVQFSIADFIREEENLGSAHGRAIQATASQDTAPAVRLSDIYYLAYNDNGVKVSYRHQDTVNQRATFGTIADSLAPGTYTIVFIASEKPIYTEALTFNNNINAHYFGPELTGVGVLPMGDLFYKKLQVTVSAAGNIATQPVTLDRIVGRLEVNILDALPATDNNGYIWTQVNPITLFYNIYNNTVRPPEYTWDWRGTRINQNTFRDYILGSDSAFNVTIHYRDKNTGADQVKVINNVKCNTNKKTIIKGYLYGVPGNPGGPAYQVRINQDWNTSSNVINF